MPRSTSTTTRRRPIRTRTTGNRPPRLTIDALQEIVRANIEQSEPTTVGIPPSQSENPQEVELTRAQILDTITVASPTPRIQPSNQPTGIAAILDNPRISEGSSHHPQVTSTIPNPPSQLRDDGLRHEFPSIESIHPPQITSTCGIEGCNEPPGHLHANVLDHSSQLSEPTHQATNIICNDCSQSVPVETTSFVNGLPYCASCYNQNFRACHVCHEMQSFTNGMFSENGNHFYCTSCIENGNGYICERCQSLFEGTPQTIHGDSFCSDCYDEQIFFCDECENTTSRSERQYHEECDQEFCDDCIGNHNCETSNERREDQQLRATPANVFLKGQVAGCRIITHSRFVGIEIEAERGKAEYLYKVLPKEVGISGDGSLHDRGIEIQTCPASLSKLEQLVQDTCRAIKSQGFKGTKACGLHVHADARDFRTDYAKIVQVIKVFYACEDLLYSMLPPSRWGQHYCQRLSKNYLYKNFSKKTTQKKFDLEWYKITDQMNLEREKRRKYNETRYYGLNVHSIFYRGTVEFRYHSGTIEPNKILYWTQIVLSMLEYALTKYDEKWVQKMFDTQTSIDKFQEWSKVMEFRNDLMNYIRARTTQFNPDYTVKFNKGKAQRIQDRKTINAKKKLLKTTMESFREGATKELTEKFLLQMAENDIGSRYFKEEVVKLMRRLALQKLGNTFDNVPVDGGFMEDNEIAVIQRWIHQGMELARNNADRNSEQADFEE